MSLTEIHKFEQDRRKSLKKLETQWDRIIKKFSDVPENDEEIDIRKKVQKFNVYAKVETLKKNDVVCIRSRVRIECMIDPKFVVVKRIKHRNPIHGRLDELCTTR